MVFVSRLVRGHYSCDLGSQLHRTRALQFCIFSDGMATATPAFRWWGGVGWWWWSVGGEEERRGGEGEEEGQGEGEEGEDLHANARRCRASSLHVFHNSVRECRLSDARRRRVLGCAYGELGVIDVAHTWLWRLNPRHGPVLDADAFTDSVRFRLGCAGPTKTRLSKLHVQLWILGRCVRSRLQLWSGRGHPWPQEQTSSMSGESEERWFDVRPTGWERSGHARSMSSALRVPSRAAHPMQRWQTVRSIRDGCGLHHSRPFGTRDV